MPFPMKGQRPCVCVVNFSSVPCHTQYDNTCVFTPGPNTHPFIQHDSFVYFAKAADLFAADVESNVNSMVWLAKLPDFSVADVQQLKAGLKISPRTPRHLSNLSI